MFLERITLVLCLAVCVFGDDHTKCAGKFDMNAREFAIGDSWTETLNNVKADCHCREHRWFFYSECHGDFCDDATRECVWDGCYSDKDGQAYPEGAAVNYGGEDCICEENEEMIADGMPEKYVINC
ncbi:unnamed protein product [Owenia fusiformis]|uniref:Uncharacterized protein n=1 Tax=Owenia fusiformis TaxID=6347 RepID=A0A8J1XPA6_OWEFU|nr:unnamed protein product [Owenia fusiformis]